MNSGFILLNIVICIFNAITANVAKKRAVRIACAVASVASGLAALVLLFGLLEP